MDTKNLNKKEEEDLQEILKTQYSDQWSKFVSKRLPEIVASIGERTPNHLIDVLYNMVGASFIEGWKEGKKKKATND